MSIARHLAKTYLAICMQRSPTAVVRTVDRHFREKNNVRGGVTILIIGPAERDSIPTVILTSSKRGFDPRWVKNKNGQRIHRISPSTLVTRSHKPIRTGTPLASLRHGAWTARGGAPERMIRCPLWPRKRESSRAAATASKGR